MWSHQYDQQVNQVQCTINPDHMWSTNGPDSNLFGLEPNYGCCTANLHQGWPKFAAHLWMRTPDEGIAAVAYAPEHRPVRGPRRSPCSVPLETDYPFRETLHADRRRAEHAGPLPAGPARSGLGRRRHDARRRAARSARSSPARSTGSSGNGRARPRCALRFPMKRQDLAPLQPGPGRRARSAGLFAEDRRDLDPRERRQTASRAAARRLRGPARRRRGTTACSWTRPEPEASIRFEEAARSGEKPFSPEGAGVVAHVKGRKLAGLETRARLGGGDAARTAGLEGTARGPDPDSLRLHEPPRDRVSAAEAVAAAVAPPRPPSPESFVVKPDAVEERKAPSTWGKGMLPRHDSGLLKAFGQAGIDLLEWDGWGIQVHLSVLGCDLAPSPKMLGERSCRSAAGPFECVMQALHMGLPDKAAGPDAAKQGNRAGLCTTVKIP